MELYNAVAQGKQGVVFAHADIFAGMEFGSALAHEDVTAQNLFAAVSFDTKASAC